MCIYVGGTLITRMLPSSLPWSERVRHLETVMDSRERCARAQRRVTGDQMRAIISMTCEAFASQEQATADLVRRIDALEQVLRDIRRL